MALEPNIVYAHWSADGKKIAYVVQDLTKPFSSWYSLYTINADGTGRTLFGNGVDPRWSPSGKKLAYIAVEPNFGHLAAWNFETNAPAFPNDDSRPHATSLGAAPDSTDVRMPRWRSEAEVWVSYSAQRLATPLLPGKALYGLLRYFTNSGSLYLESSDRSSNLSDLALNDGMGLVSRGNLGYSSSESDIFWLYPNNNTLALLTRTTGGSGMFSPDGERLWINLNNGKGIRLYDRNLNDLGALVPPNGTKITWFSE